MIRPEAFSMERSPASAELNVEIVDIAFYGERRRIVARIAAGQEVDIRPTSAAMQSRVALHTAGLFRSGCCIPVSGLTKPRWIAALQRFAAMEACLGASRS